MYWPPPATGPPTPSLKNGSIFASAPPPWSSTTPVRTMTTRRPRSAARRASRSQITQTSARKSLPARSLLVERARRRAGRSSRRRRRRPARAGAGRPPRSRPRGCACRARARSGCGAWRRRSSAGRRSRPRGGRRASRPASAAAGAGSSSGCHATAPGEEGLRDSVVTSSPRARRRSTSSAADQAAGSCDGDSHARGTAGRGCLGHPRISLPARSRIGRTNSTMAVTCQSSRSRTSPRTSAPCARSTI